MRTKEPLYWLFTIFFILLGFYVSFWLAQFSWWQDASYASYNAVQWLTPATTTHPSHTALVLIDDDDYWRGEWARRQPLKRDTLAKLLRAIAKANPRAIGIDVDLRCQTPDGSYAMDAAYGNETKELFDTADAIAKTVPVVFAKTVGFDDKSQKFVVDADLFDAVKFENKKNIAAGYTRLPHDLRQVALNAAAAGVKLDSFAAVISRVDPVSSKTALVRAGVSLPYVRSFLSKASFRDACVPARKVLAGDVDALRALANKVVIIGGDWHQEAWGRGVNIDEHITPQGRMPGALIHANYVEAVISEQMTTPSREWLRFGIDLAVGSALASILVCAIGYWKIFYLAVLAALVCAISLVAWSNIGTFVDAAPPLILLSGHAAMDKVIDWKRKADLHDCECGADS